MKNYRDQDGDTNEDDNSRLGSKSSSISSNDHLQTGKSMSIMNTQQNNKDKGDQSLNQRNVSSSSVENRSSANITNAQNPASVTSNMTSNNSSTNTSNNTNNTLSTTNSGSLDNASSDTHLPSTNAGNTSLSSQGREPK